MRSFLRLLFTMSLLLVPWSGSYAQEVLPRASAGDVGLSAERLDEITELLDQFVAEGRIAGAVAGVARRGGLAYLEAVGFQNLETRVPMTDQSLFRIYSMAKTVTAVAVMMLHEEGRFELDDPVSRYLSAFDRVRVLDAATGETRPPVRPVTIRDLLVHTGGLSHRNSQLYRDLQVRSRSIPMSQFIENVVAAPLMDDPGDVYRYSASPTVLGALVEVWSGQPFDVFLRERVFEPLDMTETGFWVEPDRQDRLTTVYRSSDGGLEPYQIEELPFTERPALLEGAVGLVSTVPDFLRFSQMLLNGGELGGVRLLTGETVASITVNGLAEGPLATRRGGSGWGLGNVSVIMDPSSPQLGEYGWDGSAGTVFWVHPREELVIVLMWQSSPANPDSLRQQIRSIVYEAVID